LDLAHLANFTSSGSQFDLERPRIIGFLAEGLEGRLALHPLAALGSSSMVMTGISCPSLFSLVRFWVRGSLSDRVSGNGQ